MNHSNCKKKLIGAEILCIGSELLLGNIINTNGHWLAQELAYIGIPHFRQCIIGDNHLRLKEAILESSRRSKFLITTGGLGPTVDDLTTETIASAFGSKLIESQEVLSDIKSKIQNKQDESLNSITKQAKVPHDAEIIPNKYGTAPGIIWSPIPGFTILTFPGVPSELKQMWTDSAAPWFKNNVQEKTLIVSKTLRFAGISESNLAENLGDLLNSQNPTVAPYASLGEVKIRITAKAKNKQEVNELINPIENKIKNKMGNKLYGTENETLQSVILKMLSERDEKLAVAESCTGGGISAEITSIPGSSVCFLGGIVAYNNQIKHDLLNVPEEILLKHGAVSAEVVELMAKGIEDKFKSDWSIAISGIAGPSGGTKEKEVGIVQFCISGPFGMRTWHESFGSHRSRKDIQKLSVLKALDQLRLFLLSDS